MECDPTRVCELLVGLGDVEVLGVDDGALRGRCGCTSAGGHRDRRAGDVVGRCGPRASAASSWWTCRRSGGRCCRPTVKHAWHKRRWRCPRSGCAAGSFSEQDSAIAPQRALLTARAGRWATRRAGRGEAIADTAAVLGCDWHTVNASVRRWGQALLDADGDRIAAVVALGLDETLFCRRGRFAQRAWSTSIVDVARGQLLDVVPGRTADGPARWLLRRPRARRVRRGCGDIPKSDSQLRGAVRVGKAPPRSTVSPAVAVVGSSARRCGADANATACRG